ncbi:MAG: PorP/SprF family type IX secretion system membrane protein [Bacteroidetes bacterium]|nr:PorP/SprF family type IX secretion system membrane protein [Bacteroidota bacterium]
MFIFMRGTIHKAKLFIRLFLIISLYLQLFDTRCQDAQFSQVNNSSILLNPSLTGEFKNGIRIQLNYMDQWRGITKPFQTIGFSYDMSLKKKKDKTGFLGAGLTFLNDRAGSSQFRLNQVNLLLAYHAKISKYNYLSAGITGGFAQRTIDISQLQWNSQYDGNNFNPNLPSYESGNSKNISYLDFGAGLEWTYTMKEDYITANNKLIIHLGAAAFHVNKPDISFYSTTSDNLPLKIILHGNTQIGIANTNYSILPSFMFVKQGALKEIVFGGSIRKGLSDEFGIQGYYKGSAISIGSLYCSSGALIPYCTLEFANYVVGISYDVNISGLAHASSDKGGVEILLRWVNINPFNL